MHSTKSSYVYLFSCSCNLHGKFCSMDETKGRFVCVCQHNTMGDNCEMCKPLYNKRPWRPGLYVPADRTPSGTANECQSKRTISQSYENYKRVINVQ